MDGHATNVVPAGRPDTQQRGTRSGLSSDSVEIHTEAFGDRLETE
jgi:hypothetical protein